MLPVRTATPLGDTVLFNYLSLVAFMIGCVPELSFRVLLAALLDANPEPTVLPGGSA